MTTQEISSAFGAKVRRNMFAPVARHITGPDADDRLQDGIAQTFEMFSRYAQRGQVLDDGILVHSCRQRAVDLGRRFVKDDTQPRRDALHPANFRDGKIEVFRLDGLLDEDGEFCGEQASSVPLGFAEALAPDPTRKINSAFDLERWIAALPAEDRELLALRYQGVTLKEAAAEIGVSLSTAFKRLRDLGWQLAERSGLQLPGTKPIPT